MLPLASFSSAHRFAFDRCPRSGPCRRPRPGWGCCAGPTGRARAPASTFWSSLTSRLAPVGTLYFSSSRPLASTIDDFAVAGEHDVAGRRRCATTFKRVYFDHAGRLARISFSSTARAAMPPMWKVRMVSCVPGSPMRLGGDDAHGHAFLDQVAGGQVHAVAAGADAQRGFAGHAGCGRGCCPGPALRSCRPISAVMSSFSRTITSSVMGLTMFARLTRPTIESARLHFDLFAACRWRPW